MSLAVRVLFGDVGESDDKPNPVASSGKGGGGCDFDVREKSWDKATGAFESPDCSRENAGKGLFVAAIGEGDGAEVVAWGSGICSERKVVEAVTTSDVDGGVTCKSTDSNRSAGGEIDGGIDAVTGGVLLEMLGITRALSKGDTDITSSAAGTVTTSMI